MKFKLLIKNLSVCILSLLMAFAAFIPEVSAYVNLNLMRFHNVHGEELPLCIAAADGNLEKVMRLVANGADVNCTGTCNMTPLHYAVSNHHLEIVKFLIEMGADVNCVDEEKRTLLHVALQYGSGLDIVRYLVEEENADVNISDNEGKTPLHEAAEWGRLDIVRYLVEKHHADVE